MLLMAIYVQLLVLSLTLIWFIAAKRRSLADLSLKFAAITILLIGLWLGSVWVYPPYWGFALITFVFLCVALRKAKRPDKKTHSIGSWLSNVPVPFIITLGAYLGLNGFVGRGQNPDGQIIDLVSPFAAEDRACVLSGGLNSLLNQHNFESNSAGDYAQLYGLDFMGFGTNGFRTHPGYRLNPKPDDYKAYVIFGVPLHAPCDGIVVWSENNKPEQVIGTADKEQTSGNGVILACADVHVKLSHMKKGSVLVSKGETVQSRQALGRVGNSGNTEEPHLHIHAETIVEEGNPWVHGEPVHMRFNGQLLARGDCL